MRPAPKKDGPRVTPETSKPASTAPAFKSGPGGALTPEGGSEGGGEDPVTPNTADGVEARGSSVSGAKPLAESATLEHGFRGVP